MVQEMIMSDPEVLLPPGQSLWTTPDMVNMTKMWPTYAPHEVAKCFFGLSTAWLRKHYQEDHHTSQEHGVVEPLRTPPSKTHPKGVMAFRLYDIERLAYALAEHRVIDAIRLERVVRIIKLHAQLHNYIS